MILKKEQYWSNLFSRLGISFYDANNVEYIAHTIATDLYSNNIRDFYYVEGFVLDEFNPVSHVWIEFEDGSVLDPTCRYLFTFHASDVERISESEGDFEVTRYDAAEYYEIFN